MKKKKKKEGNIILKILTFVLILGIALILYSHFIGTKGLNIREYAIKNSKIPINYDGLKIVHFTDLHYGSTIKTKEMKIVVTNINNLKPDLVVFTGDLIEEQYNMSETEIDELVNELNNIDAGLGKYYIRGNHDNNSSFDTIISKTDFKDLNNKNELIYYNDITPIVLVGLDDPISFEPNIQNAFDLDNENNYYTILLTHEPDLIDQIKDYNVDLVLAGHSHNGQVRVPFLGAIWTPLGSKKYYDEVYGLNNGTMYISGGIGTSAAPFRFLVKPSFNFYRLYTEE